MHHPLIILVDTKGIVHELQEMWRRDDIVLEDDDGVVLLKDSISAADRSNEAMLRSR